MAAHEPAPGRPEQRRVRAARRGEPARCSPASGPTCPSTRCRSRRSPTACTPAPGRRREMADLYERVLGDDWPEAPAEAWTAARVGPRPRAVGRPARLPRAAGARTPAAACARHGARRGASASRRWRGPTTCSTPPSLTIGFARRFATYKRATLLFRDLDRLQGAAARRGAARAARRSPARPTRPTTRARSCCSQVATVAADLDLRHRLVLLEDYDITVARMLVGGVDVWLNTPLRPLEACGTSGMKAVFNGVLNCSILDGWWDEMYDSDVGWAIPSAEWQDDIEARNDARGHQPVQPARAPGRAAVLQARRRRPARRVAAPRSRRRWPGSVPQVEASAGCCKEYTTELYEPAAAPQRATCGPTTTPGPRRSCAWKRTGLPRLAVGGGHQHRPTRRPPAPTGTTYQVTAQVVARRARARATSRCRSSTAPSTSTTSCATRSSSR